MNFFKTIAFVTLALLPVTLTAQSLDPVVEVSSQYKVDMGEIHKPAINVNVEDSLQRFDINFDYSIYDRPYQNLYVFAPYSYTQIKHPQEIKNNILFAELGYQSILSPSGHIVIQGVTKKNFAACAYANFDGYFRGDTDMAPFYLWNVLEGRYHTDFGTNMKYAWRSGEVQFDANYRILDGQYSLVDNHSDKVTLTALVNSANKDLNSIDYNFLASFHNLRAENSMSDMTESLFSIDGAVGTTFDIHRVYVDIDVDMAAYRKSRAHEAWILEFAPIYEYNRGRLFGKFGAKFGSRFASKVEDNESGIDHKGNMTNIFPMIDAKYTLIKNHLWVHALATGSNYMNSMESMVAQCPVVDLNSRMLFGHTPIDAQLSVETSLGGVFSINATGGYSLNRDMMIIGTDMLSSANAVIPIATYWDLERLHAGAEAVLKIDHFSIGGDVTFNKYIDWFEEIEQDVLPKVVAHAYADFDLRERVFLSVKCDYQSASRFMPEMVNLGTKIDVVVNRHFSVFFKGDNLLNQKLFLAPLYCGRERNFGGGITVDF